MTGVAAYCQRIADEAPALSLEETGRIAALLPRVQPEQAQRAS